MITSGVLGTADLNNLKLGALLIFHTTMAYTYEHLSIQTQHLTHLAAHCFCFYYLHHYISMLLCFTQHFNALIVSFIFTSAAMSRSQNQNKLTLL